MPLPQPRHLAFVFAIALVANSAAGLASSHGITPVHAAAVRQAGDRSHPLVTQLESDRVAAGLPPLVTPGPTKPSAQASTQGTSIYVGKPQREVMGFALASSLSDPTLGYPSWNFELISTLSFFALHVDWTGHIVQTDNAWSVWNSSALTNFVNFAHSNGVKVLVTVDMHDFGSGTPNMCSALQRSSITISETAAQVSAKGVDGVNIDYEGQNNSCGTSDPLWVRHAMTAFTHDMRVAIGSSRYLYIDTYSGAVGDPEDFFDIPSLNPYVDVFFVMTYDMEYSNWAYPPVSCPTFCLGPTSPLTAYYYNDTNVMANYAAAVGASKVELGIPYYGRKACVPQAVANADPSSSVIADMYVDAAGEATDPSVMPGSYVAHREYRSSGLERWDTWNNSTLNCIRELYWDDTLSLGKKYDLANADGLRGIGIWTLNYGGSSTELWNTIYSHFVGCSSSGIGASPQAPLARGSAVNISAAAYGCANPEYRYWVLPPGGTWTMVQDYTSATSYAWNTAGVAPGAYRFAVWARNVGSPNAYDVYSTMSYSVTAPCTGLTIAQAPPSPQISSTTVTLSAAGSGCPNPNYRFWILPPNGVWTMVQDYTTTATYAWNTTGIRAGVYGISVWAKDPSTGGSFDLYRTANFAITSPCSSASISSSPPAPQQAGTFVTLSGATGACPNPQYRFYVLPPGGSWTLIQDYSAVNAYSWDTSTVAAGTYRFSVWARDAASTASYDAYGTTYYLVTRRCTSLALATRSNITSVAVDASASGCPTPRFRFWLLAPGAGWTMVQDYSSSTSYVWNTAHLAAGSYRFSVWAQDATSPGSYDTYTTLTYSFAPCTSDSVSATPASPQSVGSSVTISSTAAGCPSPRYRFWILAPGGTWTMVQDYGGGSSYAWNTTGLAPGTYTFSVWALDASSGSGYDTYRTYTFVLK